MEFDTVSLFLWVIFPYFVIVTAYFAVVFWYLSRLKKKLSAIELRLVQKVEKDTLEKEKSREQRLVRLKNEIDEMLHDGNR